MSDEEFEALLLYAEKTMGDNYQKIFRKAYGLWVFLMEHELVLRQLRRVRKLVSLEAWKRKINSILSQKSLELTFEKAQIEELYFRL